MSSVRLAGVTFPLTSLRSRPMKTDSPVNKDSSLDNDLSSTEPVAVQHGLADDLRRLDEAANGMPISLNTLVSVLEDRGHAVAIILLAAPFVIIPIPGLSTIVGLAVLMLSIGVLLGSKARLPNFIGKRNISPEGLHRIVSGTSRVLIRVEKLVKPRMEWLTGKSWHWLIGLSLIFATIALMLPLPIPGNNIPPAIGILLLALGLLERDGLFVLIGHIYTLAMWIVLLTVAMFFWEAIDTYVHRVFNKIVHLFD